MQKEFKRLTITDNLLKYETWDQTKFYNRIKYKV